MSGNGSEAGGWGSDSPVFLPAHYKPDPRSYQPFSPFFGKTEGGCAADLETLQELLTWLPDHRGTQVLAKVSAQGRELVYVPGEPREVTGCTE